MDIFPSVTTAESLSSVAFVVSAVVVVLPAVSVAVNDTFLFVASIEPPPSSVIV